MSRLLPVFDLVGLLYLRVVKVLLGLAISAISGPIVGLLAEREHEAGGLLRPQWPTDLRLLNFWRLEGYLTSATAGELVRFLPRVLV